MPEREKPRICVDVAGDIKGEIEKALEEHGRVPPLIAKALRKVAQVDADHHIKYDPSFLCGGGPAEREKSSD